MLVYHNVMLRLQDNTIFVHGEVRSFMYMVVVLLFFRQIYSRRFCCFLQFGYKERTSQKQLTDIQLVVYMYL